MDMSGVTPTPADRSSSLRSAACGKMKSPDGPVARSRAPGRTVSCSQLDTNPPETRLLVTVMVSGRVGGEAMV